MQKKVERKYFLVGRPYSVFYGLRGSDPNLRSKAVNCSFLLEADFNPNEAKFSDWTLVVENRRCGTRHTYPVDFTNDTVGRGVPFDRNMLEARHYLRDVYHYI